MAKDRLIFEDISRELMEIKRAEGYVIQEVET